MKRVLGKRILYGTLSCFMVISNMTFVHAEEPSQGRNLQQQSIQTIENMPNLPNNYKLIDWLSRGQELHNFIFDYTATNFDKKTEFSVKDGRTFATIYRDDKYGGYMIPAFYGENRPIVDTNGHDGEDDQESIATVSALIAASLMGIDMNQELPDELKGQTTIDGGYTINTYLDNALKYFWTDKGDVFTNVPNGSASKLQNKDNVSNAYGDFWYLLIANQNFFRLAALNPDWRSDEILGLQEKVADKMVEMVDILMATDDKFKIQCFDFEHMQPLENSQWRQPDSAVGTANILYYAYKIFKDKNPEKANTYLKYAKTCMDYLDGLTDNPYYENMLIDAVYLSTMMNAEVGTHYNTTKYIEWITSSSGSSVRSWGGVNYTQDGIDVYGMTGEPGNGYCYFFNSIYPMTSILPAAKYDPSYARMAGKWALNIANASRYFLPTEWSEEHQTDGNYIGKTEGNVLAYESLRKNGNGQNFYATGDAKQNATGGWKAGPNTTNFGLYGGVYTGYLGALVEETDVEGILKLDCNKTDYYQNDMYETYLYYNPYMESREVTIDLGNEHYDLYDSVTGTYVAKDVTGQQKIHLLADSAKVIVLADANSELKYEGNTTYINDKFVAHSDANVLPDQGTELIESITIEGLDNITQREQTSQYTAVITPTENVMDSRLIWSVTDVNGQATDKATITSDGILTVKKNGTVKVKASSIDGSGQYGEKTVQISGQTLASLSQDKPITVSTVNDNNHGGNLAVDGDTTTRWIANAGEAHPWIYVDLGSQADINLLILNWEAARPRKYDIQISDDAQNWTTVKTVDTTQEGDNDTSRVVRLELDQNVQGRYVRIYTQEKSKYGCSLYEFDVYGNYSHIETPISGITVSAENNATKITTKNKPLQMTAILTPDNATDKRVEWFVYNEDGSETTKAEMTSSGKLIPLENGTVKVVAKAVDGSSVTGEYLVTLENQDKDNLALGKTVYVSHEDSANPKSCAVDGDTETRWASGNNVEQNQWITVDLGDVYDVDKVVLYWEAAYAKKYKIQGSLDNKTFTDIYKENASDGGTNEITFEPQQARYIRMQNIELATSYGCSLWEFEVYGNEIVKIHPNQIMVSSELENNVISIKKQQVQMQVSVLPENTTDKSVTWSVVNEDGSEITKATISKDGVLTAKENGVVKVIATANDGSGVQGSLLVTITHQEIENIALKKDVSATTEDGGNLASYVNDGSLTSRWASQGNNEQSITIDLGDLYYVNQVILNWEAAYGKKYQILGSVDSDNWIPLYEENNGNGDIDNLIFNQQLVRYVRMQGIERGTQWGYSLYEFEVYGKTLKADLQSLYDEYKGIQADSYTPNSYSVFETALTKALAVLEDNQATENDVQEAYTQLEKAQASLVKQADKKALSEAIDSAKKIDTELYTPNSVDEFNKVVSEIEKVLANGNATEDEIADAINSLTEAYKILVTRADNSELKTVVKQAEELDKNLYTLVSYQALQVAIKEANAVLNDSNATEKQINDAIEKVNKAKKGLAEVRRDALNEMLSNATAVDLTQYTQDSVKELETAIANAQAALKTTDQEAIDAAYQALQEAYKGLVKEEKPEEPTKPVEPVEPTKPVEPSQPGEEPPVVDVPETPNQPDQTEEEVPVQPTQPVVTPGNGEEVNTSDETPIVLLTFGLVVSGMGYLIARKRKEN